MPNFVQFHDICLEIRNDTITDSP